MILWFTGPSGSGKTTAAKDLIAQMNNVIHLDGDDMRATISEDLGYSDEDRYKNNIRIAKLAALLGKQGFNVVVSTICPDINDLRTEVWRITRCRFINL